MCTLDRYIKLPAQLTHYSGTHGVATARKIEAENKPARLVGQQERAPGFNWLQIGLTLLMVICLALTALHPLMFGSLPRTDDALQHLYRLTALDDSIHHGDLWPRYVPTLVYGYGIPLFNFYSPVSLYPLEALHLLGFSFLNALLSGLMFYTLLGVLGAYLLGKRWSGVLGGIATAAAYAYAPYCLFNLYQRGAVGEVAGLALLPWVLWAFDRLAERGRRRDFMLAVICLGLLILTHNITAVYGVVLLAAYCLLLWWTGRRPPHIFVHLVLAAVAAVGLTTFFWLPALAEIQYVQIQRMNIGVAADPSDPLFYTAFQTLGQTFALPETADLTRFNQPAQITIGWPQTILILLGVVMLIWQCMSGDDEVSELRNKVILALVLCVGLIFSTTRLSAWLWIAIPFIRHFQFPWRGLGPASLMIALAAGAGTALVARRLPWRIGRIAWTALCVVAMILYALPWLYRLYIPNPPARSIVDAQNYERQTGQIGGTAFGDYLPVWVKDVPDAKRLIGLYAQSDIIPRLQPLPGIVTVSEERWGQTRAHLTFTAAEATTLTLDWLYFPGWWAEMDGEHVTLFPTEPNGFVGIHVPAGEHDLEIGFGPTPLRLGAMIASGVFVLALLALLALAKFMWQNPGANLSGAVSETGGERPTSWPVLLSIALVGGLLLASKALLIDDIQSPFKRARFASGIEAGLQIPVQASFEGQIDLLGYDLVPSHLIPGQTADLNLYWQPMAGKIAGDYSSVVYALDSAGTVVAQAGSTYPGGWATSDWLPGFYVLDHLTLSFPLGTPPGEYTLEASLYWYADNHALNTFDRLGTPLGTTVPIGKVIVERPARAMSTETLRIGADSTLHWLDAAMAGGIQLLAANEPPAAAEVGQQFIFLTYWGAQQKPEKPYSFRVVWLDEDSQIAAYAPSTSLAVGYPVEEWQAGDVWKGLHSLYVPGRLEAGDYTVALQLFDGEEAAGEPAEIGRMAVSTPARLFQVPPMDVAADVAWENGIHLVGYDLAKESVERGDGAELTLYWQTQADITTSLTVFVHIYDADGATIAQQDSIPLGGARPTTGWAPGEILVDRYAIPIPANIPPGRYSIRVGLYDAVTSQRVHLNDGSEFWILPQTIRVPGE
jgi:hypothetical protein